MNITFQSCRVHLCGTPGVQITFLYCSYFSSHIWNHLNLTTSVSQTWMWNLCYNFSPVSLKEKTSIHISFNMVLLLWAPWVHIIATMYPWLLCASSLLCPFNTGSSAVHCRLSLPAFYRWGTRGPREESNTTLSSTLDTEFYYTPAAL